MPEWVTALEAAVLTGATEIVVLDAVRSGRLQANPLSMGKGSSGVLLVRLRDVQALVEETGRPAAPTPAPPAPTPFDLATGSPAAPGAPAATAPAQPAADAAPAAGPASEQGPDQGAFTSQSLVLATGGLSIPKMGATAFALGRRVLLVIGVGLLSSGMAAGAWAGLRSPPAGSVRARATLRTTVRPRLDLRFPRLFADVLFLAAKVAADYAELTS